MGIQIISTFFYFDKTNQCFSYYWRRAGHNEAPEGRGGVPGAPDSEEEDERGEGEKWESEGEGCWDFCQVRILILSTKLIIGT